MVIKNYWPEGYEEDFKVLDLPMLKKAISELSGDTCLEIGCGNGRWTNELLVPKFKEVHSVDIIEKPKYEGFKYYKTTDCNLTPFNGLKFDCVYSYGVFCHLPLECQKTYLKAIRKLLTGKGLIMFANWDRHPALQGRKDEFLDGWFYNDLEITGKMLKETGFEWIDFDINNRDTLAVIW